MDHIFYRTVNSVNGKFYYGVHNNSKPHYLGSGVTLKKAMLKHGKDNFTRFDLMVGLSKDEAYELEDFVVDLEMINNPMCYNECLGGFGGSPYAKGISNSTRAKMVESGKTKVFTDEHKENLSKSKKGKPSHRKGGVLPNNVKSKISESLKATAEERGGCIGPTIPVLDTETGVFYNGTREAFDEAYSGHLKKRAFTAQVQGYNKNKTKFLILRD